MAVYQFSTLSDGQAISFNPSADRLNFDQTTIAAGDLSLVAEGNSLRVTVKSGPAAGKDVVLLNTQVADVATSNFSFADGSTALVGDNFWGAFNDDTSNNWTGGAGRDLLMGLGGQDFLNGGNGNDSLVGGADADSVRGDGGNDWVEGGTGIDTLVGGGGQDVFIFREAGASNADSLPDFASNWDAIQLDAAGFSAIGAAGRFASGDARFFAGTAAHDADDRVIFNSATGQIFYDADGNGAGAQQLIATLGAGRGVVAGDFTVIGTAGGGGGNTINGTSGDDTIVGTAAADTINGLGGNDELFGADGADRVVGGDGSDSLYGLDSDFPFTLNSFADTLDGGAGNDAFFVRGAEILVDSGGIDTVHTTVDWTLGAGFENLVLQGDSSLRLTGNELNNLIDHGVPFTESGTSVIAAGGGNDTITGWGDARIDGGTGNDVLFGANRNILTGGSGADAFVLRAGISDPDDTNTITDFASGVDKLHIEFDVGAQGNFSASDPRFHAAAGANAAHDADDRIIYDTSSGLLYWDGDGTGSAQPALIIARLSGAPTVVASDIFATTGTPPGQTINGTPGNDSLLGGAGNDTINGFAGNDTIDGAGGADSMDGGSGNDLYFVDNTGDQVIELENGGIDEVRSSLQSTGLSDWVNNLTLTNNSLAFVVGGGNAIDNVLSATALTVQAQLDGMSGNDTLLGGAANDELNGWDGNDSMVGGAGNDSFDAFNHPQDGVDTMDGGAGDDQFFVSAGDVTLGGDGVDTVWAMMSWTLADTVENLVLHTGTDDHDLVGVTATGNASNNVIDAGSDVVQSTFDGKAGNDTLIGGGDGVDFLFTVSPGAANADVIVNFTASNAIVLDGTVHADIGTTGRFSIGDARFFSAAGANSGHDADDRVVYNTSTGQLWYDADGSGAGAAQLIATLQGAPGLLASHIEAINGTSGGSTINGTEGNDTLTGTSGADTLNGLGGNDSLDGQAGADVLNGGAGNDTLSARYLVDGDGAADTLDGGLGDDVYIVHADGDTIVADPGGIDTVVAVNTMEWTLGTGLENLDIDDSGLEDFGASATGNELDNTIRGGSNGGVLSGLGGDDLLISRSAEPWNLTWLYGGDGDDTLRGGVGPSEMDGGAGNDVLIGAGDNDVAAGGAGADSFIFQGSFHAISDFASGTDQLRFDGTVFTDIGASGNFAAGDARFFAGTAAHDADDRIIYDAASGDLWYDADGNGAEDATLVARFLSNVVATDIAVDNGTAPGGQTLNGTVGDDTLIGGDGNDTINGLGGNDSLRGGEGADSMVGGDGNDMLDALTDQSSPRQTDDIDTLDGGLGNDGYRIWHGGAEIIDAGGIDTVFLNIDGEFTLQDGLENLTIVGTSNDNVGITGNALDNVIIGSGAVLRIDGGAGNDTITSDLFSDVLRGGTGNDSLFSGLGFDSLIGGDGNDTLNAVDSIFLGDQVSDTLEGGLGNDLYLVREDDVILADAGGIDTVETFNTDWTLGAGLENLDLEDSGIGVDGTGNELNNVIRSASEGGTLSGMGGDDLLISRIAQNHLAMLGGDGNDTLLSGWGADVLDGGAGNDLISGGSHADSMTGGAGADTFVAAFDGDIVTDFSAGADKFQFDGTQFTQIGATGNFAAGDARFFAGTAAHDADDRVIFDAASGSLWYDADGNGAGSAALLAQVTGNVAATDITVINGTAGGGGTINGTPGNDSLTGTAGNDTINGNAGNDTLRGLAGDDSLDGGSGTDLLDGGLGNDFYVVTTGDTLTDAGGNDTVVALNSWALGSGFENLILATGALDGSGNSGANRIEGNASNNVLRARDGNDTVTGGGGSDFFDFTTAPSAANADTITDFSSVDQLRFEDGAFTAIGATGTWAATDGRFWASTAGTAHDASDRVVYNTSTGQVYYDADGSGAGAAQLVATLQGAPTLAATDITVI